MLRIPFPSIGLENVTLFRGGKPSKRRARRDALKDGLSLSRQPHRSPLTKMKTLIQCRIVMSPSPSLSVPHRHLASRLNL